MESNLYSDKRNKAIALLEEITEVNNANIAHNMKISSLTSLWIEYTKLGFVPSEYAEFAKETNISKLISEGPYVIDQDPNMEEVNAEEVRASVLKLEEVLQLRKEGKNDVGIEEEDANNILKWSVLNARKEYSKNYNLLEGSLRGFCGYGQALSLIPLQDLGLDITINNVGEAFSISKRHAFGTVIFPINTIDGNGKKVVINKQYLVDTTCRQFFNVAECNLGAYYCGDSRFQGQISPAPGYFMIQSDKGKSLATELLRDGYISLTEENAKIYGDSFVASTYGLNKIHLLKGKFDTTKGRDYIVDILSKQEDFDYTLEEFNSLGVNLKFPSDKNSKYSSGLELK